MLLASASAVAEDATSPGESSSAGIEYFEKKIRPIFAEHCTECHGQEKAQAGLRLDVAEGWSEGGDSGPALVAGKPEESLIIHAIKHDGESSEMPPEGKLSPETIRLLEEWVRSGAPAPKSARTSAKSEIDWDKAREFWSYRPIQDVPPPGSSATARADIDLLIDARLAEAGVSASDEASRETLARRLYFDLCGIPPTPEELDAFLADESPTAYESLVDRLLASPRFAERWGRHWLDVVRYGESVTLRGLVFHEAWRYRDYVIESFNRDRPIDEFLRQQIAGDLLSAHTIEERQDQQVAVTFLTLGNTNLEEQDKRQLDMDVVDEQLDVLGKAFLGQTIGCARCHDHKFDPIPTRDYYALAGILRNTQVLQHENVSKWMEAPLPLSPEESARFEAMETELNSVVAEIETVKATIKKLDPSADQSSNVGIAKVSELLGVVVDDRQAKKVGVWSESTSVKSYIGEGYIHDANAGKGEKTLTFVAMLPKDGVYEVRLAYTASSNRATNVPVTVFSAEGEATVTVDMKSLPAIEGRFASLGTFRFESAGQSFVIVTNEGTNGHVVADAVQFLPYNADEKVAKTPQDEPSEGLAEARKQLKQLDQRAAKFRASLAERPKGMTVAERSNISDAPIHLRGSVLTLGEVVPRGFLQVVPGVSTEPLPSHQSGRRELSNWITSTDNPLTSRVYVNRVWHWLMGRGIVDSVDNFGQTGSKPTHPELLDRLAHSFMQRDWSTKDLVRDVVSSRVYRQASRREPMAGDEENRLWSHADRKRLDAESIRDALLMISGQIEDSYLGSSLRKGLAADYGYVHEGNRRSLYLPVLRNAVPDIFEVFDFADPSMVVGQRNTSIVAGQSLYLMNSPFVARQAEAAGRRLESNDASMDERLARVFRETITRSPTADEYRWGREFVSEAPPARAWVDLYHILFMSVDFRYLD